MNGDRRRQKGPWLQIALFLLTCLTTTIAGAFGADLMFDPLGVLFRLFSNPSQLISGLPFAATLITILLVHEMGHYLLSRYHGVNATLPYFIPAPSFIGTFGAFITMKSAPPDRRSLFDVAAAGPLAGLVLAIPAVILGLTLSRVSPEESGGGLALGSSLLLSFLSQVTLGILPDEANIVIHPIGFAGWIGLLVTAMNLLPVGQLDGGHIVYALFGERYLWVSRAALLGILLLGVLRWWDGWLVWGALLLFMGLRHPPPLDPYTPLDAKRKFMGWVMLAILTVTFIPVPFSIQEPSVRQERLGPKPAALPLVEARDHGGPR